MKKLALVSLFLLVVFGMAVPAYSEILTNNVDRDKFQYVVPFQFATADVGVTLTTSTLPIIYDLGTTGTKTNYYYAIYRGSTDGNTLPARIVGMAASGSAACTSGAATFDITINGAQTGIKAVIEPAPNRNAVGLNGATGATYTYIEQYRDDVAVPKGFNMGPRASINGDWYNWSYPYGYATPLVAGDRIGVNVTTSSGFLPALTTDYIVVIYVLE